MYTYEASHITEVPFGYQAEVIALVTKAMEENLLITVQLQTLYYNDETIVDLYGVYALNEQEVENYNENGGLWYYSNPTDFIA
jgi:hypothetical protein